MTLSPCSRRADALVRLILACGLVALCGCSSESGSNAAGTRPQAPVPVNVATVVQRDIPVQLRTIGKVEAYSTVAIKSQVEGQLGQVHFKEGQWVQKDALLFTIDPRPFEAALREAEASLAKDVAEAKNAKVEADRRARLLDQGFVSRDEFDAAQTRAASMEASVNADQARVENAKLQLQYCYIHAPIDGRVGQLLVHEGNVVKENDTTLAIINQVKPIYVTFSLPEQDLPAIRQRSATAKLAVDALVNRERSDPVIGELSFINNTVDTATGTVLLKAEYANADEKLWPGQFVDVALTLSIHADAIVIPAEAIQMGQQGQFVFVVSPDMTAEPRPVVAGDTVAGEVVVAQGLRAGERIVTDGQIRLAPGSPVQIKEAANPDAQKVSASDSRDK